MEKSQAWGNMGGILKYQSTEENEVMIDSLIGRLTGFSHNPVRNWSLEFEGERAYYSIYRLKEDQLNALTPYAAPVRGDSMLNMELSLTTDEFLSSLAKIYTALRLSFGESGERYDYYKSGFSYLFLVTISKSENSYYILRFGDIKGSIEIKFFKILSQKPNRENVGYILEADEDFTWDEMSYLTYFFLGYLRGYFRAISPYYNEPFVKTVLSELIIYGYLDGEFFDKKFDTPEAHDAAMALAQRRCEENRAEARSEPFPQS